MLDLNNIFYSDECDCGCGHAKEHEHEHNHEHEHEHEHSCGCGCGCEDEGEIGESIVTMVDEETGEEYQFSIVDDFDFEGEVYCVLLTVDKDPEALIVKVVTDENDNDYFMSLEDEEYDRVSAEYERILAEADDEDDDGSEYVIEGGKE